MLRQQEAADYWERAGALQAMVDEQLSPEDQVGRGAVLGSFSPRGVRSKSAVGGRRFCCPGNAGQGVRSRLHSALSTRYSVLECEAVTQ